MTITQSFKTWHIVVGIATFFIFLGTGVYMGVHFPDLYQVNEIIRYQYRANHVYILFSGLVNIGTGLYIMYNPIGWRRVLQILGSIFLFLAPILLMLAFFFEPLHASPSRPLTLIGVIFCLAGIGFHFSGASRLGRKEN